MASAMRQGPTRKENGKVGFKANGNIYFFGEEATAGLGGAGGADRSFQPHIDFQIPIEVAA
jgi:hypothetical protein